MGEDAIEEELEKIKGHILGAEVSRVYGMLTCNGDACSVGVWLLGAECANNLGEGNFLAEIECYVLVPDDVKGVGALHSMLGGVIGVRSYELSETAKLVGVRLVPGWTEAGVAAELAVLHGFTWRRVEDGER